MSTTPTGQVAALVGGKRLLSSVLQRLKSDRVDIDHIWSELRYVVAQGARALADGVLGKVPGVDPVKMWPYGQYRSERMPRDSFHVLGFDVMFDNHLNASLLEVNCNPSMAVDEVHIAEAPNAPPSVNCNPSMAVDEVHIAEAANYNECPHRAPQPDAGLEAWMQASLALCKGRGVRLPKP
ncbi:hypothetical protein T484DRAFT_1835410 [Baffinella frigidus]|nr:hypothetical protein T484DRAFT_1835410 [Cryptophyta sp. CCMP2293]